jgi:hypothetical protein
VATPMAVTHKPAMMVLKRIVFSLDFVSCGNDW